MARLIEIKEGKPFGFIGKDRKTVEFSKETKEKIEAIAPFIIFLKEKNIQASIYLLWEYIDKTEE